MKLIIRYRDYKEKPGSYLSQVDDLGVEKQLFLITPRQMTRKEQEDFKRQFTLTNAGYSVIPGKKYRKQISDEQIKEVTSNDYNVEIADILKDPATKRFKKEKAEDRDYLDLDDSGDLSKLI